MHSICQSIVLMFLLALVTWTMPAKGVIQPKRAHQNSAEFRNFPEAPLVKEQVRFWTAIFQRFPATSVLIHDAFHPTLIIDLIDHEVFANKLGQTQLNNRKKREALSKQYLDRYQIGLDRFAKFQSHAAKMGAIEERLYNVYRKHPTALKDLYLGRTSIRYQAGLADEFQRASKRASQYLPHMERIFAESGLPIDLTRVAFVESMFNLEALSKVGASGIWQFMPGTAKRFMRVDPFIDERNNPLKATRAAALLLEENFRHLGTWPLAVTAYNHGAAGLQKAVRNLGTKDFGVIAKNYNGRTFGFASRNFYAEFIAARNVYNSMFRKYHTRDDAADVSVIKLDRSVNLDYLMRHTPLTQAILIEHNRCLSPRAFVRYKHDPLPKGFELIVPRHLAKSVSIAINKTQTINRVRL